VSACDDLFSGGGRGKIGQKEQDRTGGVTVFRLLVVCYDQDIRFADAGSAT
jgi:hypothetical protein